MNKSNTAIIGRALENEIRCMMERLYKLGQTMHVPDVRFRKRNFGRGRKTDEYIASTGIVIAPIGAKAAGGVSGAEDVRYRYLLSIGDGTYSDEIEDDNWPVAEWEQAIRQRFQQARLEARVIHGCVLSTVVAPGRLPDRAKLTDDVDATLLEIGVWVREDYRHQL